MKISSFSALALALGSFGVGCTAAAPAQDEIAVEGSADALTLAECAKQQDQCFAKNPLLGFLTCPAQYAQCTATASNGIPAQVTSAIQDAADCTDAATTCIRRANRERDAVKRAGKLAVCAEDEAQCVAAIVGADLPDVVEGTVDCVNESVACINAAKRVSDLGACGTGLEGCALDVVTAALPQEVVDVVQDITVCTRERNACINAAETAADLTQCGEDNVQCVAGTLNVTLPDVPLSEVVACAEDAASCTLDSSSIADIRSCAGDLGDCAADVIESVDVPAQLTCEQKWTACLAGNPLNFLLCGAQLATCQD